METQRIFEVLGIKETKDENEIKKAYRNKLASTNPEDNPEGFKRLREAYENALAMAKCPKAAEEEPDTPVSLYLKEVDNIYRSLSRRLDGGEWERLVKNELLDDLELEEEIKWKLFRYLADHFRMPAAIWQILDKAFGIAENAGEFKEHLAEGFVDFMVRKCAEGEDAPDFPFAKLSGEDTADYDGFIDHFNQLTAMIREEPEDKENWLKGIGQKIAFLDTFGIAHPWYEMEKARYALLCGRKEDAERVARKLWEEGEKDSRMLFSGAHILARCGKGEEAAEVYKELLGRKGMTKDDIYVSAMALADIYAEKQEWETVMEYALCARRIYNTERAIELLNKSNAKIIALYECDGEKAAEMDTAKGVMLAWCYVQSDRAAEGLEFFEKHPVLSEDTAECHRAKAVLFLAGGRDEETEAEVKFWRQCLLGQEEKKTYPLAQSFELEGRALQMRFGKLEEKEGEEAEKIKAAALAAFDEAIARQPEDMNFLMAKLHFLRDIKDYGQIVEVCEKMKEKDADNYWVYFYAQEAYEGLGKAQEVVDTFYEAKRIYAGRPEIYERAAGAFWAYGQYRETKNIIRQAEEAGINSYDLRLKKLEMMRREAEDADAMKAADEYAKELLEEMEKAEGVNKRLLSDVYLQRALIHDSRYAGGFCQVEEIEKWAKRSVELADNNRNRYFLGRFYKEYRDEPKTAYEHLKICEERGLDFEWMYFYLALCHEDFEEWDDAIAYYKKAMEKNPQEQDFPWRVAWLYRKKFDRVGQREYFEEAMKYLKLHVEKFGENPRELWQLSDLHGDDREYELALAEIERAMEKDGQSRNWGQKGMLLGLLGRKEEAIDCYEKAIAVSLEKGKDYSYSYYQMHDYFCERREYEKGLLWFEERIGKVKTEEQRRKILGYIKYDAIALKDWAKALATIEQMYGGTTLADYVCDGWEMEGERIDDLLDMYQLCLGPEELRRKAEEATALLEGEGAAGLKEGHKGKQNAYIQIAYCYNDYLFDGEKGLAFFQKALEQAALAGAGFASSSYRWVLRSIMRILWRNGELDRAKEYRALYLKSIEESNKECKGLGKSLEELYLGDCTSRRTSFYGMFLISYYCGEYEKAGKYLQQMGECRWCSACARKGCTEEWECKGYMALHEGDREEAVRCFERAIECSVRGNDPAALELRILKR